MRKLSAIAVLLTIAATLPAAAYTQADAEACTPDAMRLCTDAMPDERRVASCLVRNKPQLSPACAAVFERVGEVNASRARPARVQDTKF